MEVICFGKFREASGLRGGGLWTVFQDVMSEAGKRILKRGIHLSREREPPVGSNRYPCS